MTGLEIGIYSVAGIFLFGMYIPAVFAFMPLTGTWFIRSNFDIAVFLLSQKSVETISSQELAVVPLFVLMGFLISISDIARETLNVANHAFRRSVVVWVWRPLLSMRTLLP